MPRKSGFTHEVEGGENITDHWLTPPSIIEAMGPFDLDPCAYKDSRTHFAATNYFLPDNDGLLMPWRGTVFCNPPYGIEPQKWIDRCSLHDDAILLVYARTETLGFRGNWRYGTAMLYFYQRISFINPLTLEKKDGGGAPSVAVAFGKQNIERLRQCKRKGVFGGGGVSNSMGILKEGESCITKCANVSSL